MLTWGHAINSRRGEASESVRATEVARFRSDKEMTFQ
jgi:hypothetical protein